jgi:hypothetical protein
MNNERKTGINTTNQGHEGYVVIRTEQELNVQPVEMQEGRWYEPVLEVARRVVDRAKEIIK